MRFLSRFRNGEVESQGAAGENSRLSDLSGFIYENWKPLLISASSLVILLLAVFLITFFSVRRSSTCDYGSSTSTTTVTSSSTSVQSTVSPTTTSTIYSSTVKSTTTLRSQPTRTTTQAPAQKICTNDFEMINGKCWKLILSSENRTNADQVCKSRNGATLVSIRNETENKSLLNFVKNQNVTSLWLGLVCSNASKLDSCIWDFENGNAIGYNNFKVGYPNTTFGGCVSYFVTGNETGKWVNMVCSQVMSFVCELPLTVQDGNCAYNYNGYCYSPSTYSFSTVGAQRFCQTQCGANSVSIHSANENRYIQTLFYVIGYISLGMLAPGPDYFIWLDGTPSNYNNIGNFTKGSCVFMTLVYGEGGEWYSVDCIKHSWFLCKRKAGIHCNV